MRPWMFPIDAASALFQSGVAMCAFVFRSFRALADATGKQAAADRADLEQKLAALTAQVEELRKEPPIVIQAGLVKPGLNLSKRSQALRMHRRGDQPEQIAAALEVPTQEIELLLKVHRIVLNSI